MPQSAPTARIHPSGAGLLPATGAGSMELGRPSPAFPRVGTRDRTGLQREGVEAAMVTAGRRGDSRSDRAGPAATDAQGRRELLPTINRAPRPGRRDPAGDSPVTPDDYPPPASSFSVTVTVTLPIVTES